MTGVIIAAAIVGGTGIIIGLFLGISGEKLKVEVDEKEVAVMEKITIIIATIKIIKVLNRFLSKFFNIRIPAVSIK